MLPKKNKLTKKLFDSVFFGGKKLHTDLFSIQYKPSSLLGCSVVVPKKLAKQATTRNQYKRRVFNLVQKHIFKEPIQMIIIIKKAPEGDNFDNVFLETLKQF